MWIFVAVVLFLLLVALPWIATRSHAAETPLSATPAVRK
jgi:hypothetical protein